jgi:hypothetical protein
VESGTFFGLDVFIIFFFLQQLHASHVVITMMPITSAVVTNANATVSAFTLCLEA